MMGCRDVNNASIIGDKIETPFQPPARGEPLEEFILFDEDDKVTFMNTRLTSEGEEIKGKARAILTDPTEGDEEVLRELHEGKRGQHQVGWKLLK
ncbi:hypothetical protein ACH5RR_008532 [Cinchona calisaya]|uniref:Uncharacterized protein n=1 Tax=Cinchona calisaya TaxID=153742 RepID=A0ABD3AF93_9GENT